MGLPASTARLWLRRGVPWPHATERARQRFYSVMDADDRLIADLTDDLDSAFEGLVLGHQDRLYTIALRMLGDPGDAEEAAQDALVRAYRALASYDRARIAELRLRPWLTTIVLNRCRSVGARRATRGPKPVSIDGDPNRPVAEPEAPEGATPSAVAERHDERERWAGRLAALPVAYRTAIVLRHVDGLSYPEAAEALGRPEGTVKAQVHRGVALLRTMLEAEARHEPEEMTA
jgi:RNA polymerase sigma-70 factor, ECF subfamily